MNKNKYILASQSPRRKELLKFLQIDFDIISSNVEEVVEDGLPFEEVVMNLASLKANDIYKNHSDSIVLGFDTLVIIDDQALGKPQSRKDAYDMLETLSGRSHTVLTGCAIVKDGKTTTFYDKAIVTFEVMSNEEINEYLDTNEPFDKAGAYGIQGYGARYVKHIDGDFYTVMGMPIHKLYQTLRGLS